jgi:hypothetical protein
VANGLPYHPLVGAGELRNPSSDLCIDKNDRTEYMDQGSISQNSVSCENLSASNFGQMSTQNHKIQIYFIIMDNNVGSLGIVRPSKAITYYIN